MLARLLLAAASSASLFAPLAVAAQPATSAPPAAAAAPAAPAAAAAPSMASPALVAKGGIVDSLRANPHFGILVKALDASNLTQTLNATPQLTFFAPPDEAFQALPPSQLTALMATANAATLQKLLTYHLVHADLDPPKITGAKGPVPSVEGQPLQIDGTGPVPLVNSAHIIQMGVHPSNGYVYVVDKVLVPSDLTLPQ
ncbi:MAG TPA: fasciclin domain-containing protein [Caulobacteraceae bacterium]|nr:fasciclin domain-containing protein [Caulobacteraceae bacterium]